MALHGRAVLARSVAACFVSRVLLDPGAWFASRDS